LSEALAAGGLETRTVGGTVEVRLAEPEKVLPDLLRWLLEQGLDIYEARPLEPSLEDMFLAVVRDGAEGGPIS
jgi:hypothetical protein